MTAAVAQTGTGISRYPFTDLPREQYDFKVTPATYNMPKGLNQSLAQKRFAMLCLYQLGATVPRVRHRRAVTSLALAAIVACTLTAHDAFATVLFRDGFESGNLTHTASGIVWGSSAHTRVNSANPRTGSYSLQFNYRAVPPGRDDWSEQRIQFHHPYTDLWFRYDLYIPGNYYHRIQPSSPSNNKFFAIYRDPYRIPGFQVNFSTEPNGSGGSDLEVHYYYNGTEQKPISPASAENFITSADLGHWHTIVIHVKVPSGNDTYDGVMQLWKDGTQFVNITNLDSWGGMDKNYINAAYFLGWSNSGYTQKTDFYIDNVIISDSPISPDSSPTSDATTAR